MVDVKEWRRLKTIGELRFERGLNLEWKKEAIQPYEYGAKPEEIQQKFTKLQLSERLETALPFKSKAKDEISLKYGSGLKHEKAKVDTIQKRHKEAVKKSAKDPTETHSREIKILEKQLARRDQSRDINKAVTAVIKTDQEHREASLLTRLYTAKKEKERKNSLRKAMKFEGKQKMAAKI